MNQREIIKQYLEREPLARERANKNRAIGNILAEKYGTGFIDGIAELSLDKNTMSDFMSDVLNYDRYWRLVTAEYPHLRGKDWETKDIVEQKAQVELGYEIGHKENVKKLKSL